MRYTLIIPSKINDQQRGIYKPKIKKAMKYLLFTLLLLFTFSCGIQSQQSDFSADNTLSELEQTDFLSSVIRYLGKLAPRANHQTKYLPEFNDYYDLLAKEHSLDLYHVDETSGVIYFLASRRAPSLHERRVSTGVVVSLDETGEITYYHEKFRTWKMDPDELSQKSAVLFAAMVKGEDLSSFYAINSGEEEYIEFPNEHTQFDTDQRRWVSSLFDPSDATGNEFSINKN